MALPVQELGYRVLAKKAQLCLSKVSYLGYEINEGKRALTSARKEAILQVREFLSATGYCCLWIPAFTEITNPLYAATGGNGLLVWTDMEKQAFQNLKKALTKAPALALPNICKPFHICS
ncbi:Gag-Pol polyprotein [Plecturocebus cupreus]